ncbi:MAG: AP-3 complex subunit delta [Candelina submexicana]|nr:MAG: AP-3 complex subunit delta [Candelina submexicana]
MQADLDFAREFEKSLYDLIRGLRHHKGNEQEYIQNSLRECRAEIRTQDMDVKATALLKLIYLEMFGHDMSWAAFHVLEVMSSSKYLQKRVGYLGAVQSFRPDTEVLMLATNLLKKDLTSPLPPTISLPLVTMPHIITPSLALSLLSDLLPRLTHSHPAIRKKTIVTLYRLALVYPETLRPAWPKIKERLMDGDEDSSVTAAIINVVCELGWRRPQDFLPLAPRLFDLLVDGGNNWMAIKIIKLFATLTPLEPRLVRKLLPPLTNIIRTTPAMSLLYECIDGIIQGGILHSAEGTTEGEEIASLCVGKLRGMIVVEGDPNLKYVALLAFNKIVTSHPHLVSLHQDVILDCIDDADISIRLRALDLVVGMVNSENINSVVGRLMRQLRISPFASVVDDLSNDRAANSGVEPAADSDDEDPEESLRPSEKKSDQPPPLPDDYRTNVIKKVLEMCSQEKYANIIDFDWYVDILVQLVRFCPASTSGVANVARGLQFQDIESDSYISKSDISHDIGYELRNVAVRVRSVRPECTRAAENLVLVGRRGQVFPISGNGGLGVLESAVWIVGEYAEYLADPRETLNSLLHPSSLTLAADVVSAYLQAIPKVFSSITSNDQLKWTPERKTMTTLLIARIVHFLEPLSTNPSLEIQERSVELLELMRLSSEAVSGADAVAEDEEDAEAPLLLTQAIPSLFTGLELNPVAPGAQKKIPLPEGLDLDSPINVNLKMLLNVSEAESIDETEYNDGERFYNRRQDALNETETAKPPPKGVEAESSSYQHREEDYLDADVLARRRAERRERNKDDPFYIPNEDSPSGLSTPFSSILKNSNGDDMDIDSIPIMDLELGEDDKEVRVKSVEAPGQPKKRKERRKFVVTVDENFSSNEISSSEAPQDEGQGTVDVDSRTKQGKVKKSLLQVDSSGLGGFSLADNSDKGDHGVLDLERQQYEEEEMAKAMREVERLRLEMQRASERIEAVKGVPPEGTMVKRKKKKKPRIPEVSGDLNVPEGATDARDDIGSSEKPKLKKKRKKRVPAGEVHPNVAHSEPS